MRCEGGRSKRSLITPVPEVVVVRVVVTAGVIGLAFGTGLAGPAEGAGVLGWAVAPSGTSESAASKVTARGRRRERDGAGVSPGTAYF